MTESSPGSPEPLRRRRARGRAAGDSWAHRVGPDVPGEAEPGQDQTSHQAGAESRLPFRRDRVRERAAEEPPLSRRAARLRAADLEGSTPATDRAGHEQASGPSTGGLPLRPWWASSAAVTDDTGTGGIAIDPGTGPAARADVPATFLRPDPVAPPPPPPPPSDPVAFREQPQVNPWPGQVRPALPPTGAPAGRSATQRTSDVGGDGRRPGPAAESGPEAPTARRPAVPPAVVELPPAADVRPRRSAPVSTRSSRRPTAPEEVVLPVDRQPVPGPLSGSPAAPGSAGTPGHHSAPDGSRVFSTGPVLPAPVLPGAVLPGVEALQERVQHPAARRDLPAVPGRRSRRGARTTLPAPTSSPAASAAPSTGTIYLPTTSGAGSAPETDLRVIPDVPPAPSAASPEPSMTATAGAAGGSRRTSGAPARDVVRRRRLSAAPDRFPALGPSGEVADAADREASHPSVRPGREAADATTRTHSSPGDRAEPGAAAAAAALEAAGGRLLHGYADAGPAGAGAAAGAGSGVAGTLDAVAGLGRAGRSGTGASRRGDTGHPRGRSVPQRSLRAMTHGADEDDTRAIPPVRARAAASNDRGDPSPARRAARGAEAAEPGVPDVEATRLTPAVRSDRTGASTGAGTPDGPRPRPPAPEARESAEPAASEGAPTRRSARTAQPGPTAQPGGAGEAAGAVAAVPAAPSRAGRNLPAAIAVGVTMGAAVLASLLIRKEAFVLVVAAAVLMALWELTGALRTKRIEVPIVPLGVGALGMLVSAFVAGEDGLLVSFALTAFGVLLWRIIDGHDGATRDVAASVFVAAYVPFLAGFAMLLLAMPDGAFRALTFIAVTVSNDVGGYAAGVLAGRHPMAPTISPKKSWEGMVGSVALCMIVGAGSVHFLLHGPIVAGLAVGAAAAVTATIGDLSESLVKRDLGIKDMGHLLPGHGGIMDRLDSLLPTAPAVYLLMLLLVPVH